MSRRCTSVVLTPAVIAVAAGLAACSPSDAGAQGGSKGSTPAAPTPAPSPNADAADAPTQPGRRVTAQDVRNSAQHGNDFAFELFRATAGPRQNFIASPLSVRHALALAWAGAAGETDAAMRRALHLPGQEGAEHAGLAGTIDSMLESNPEDEKRPEVSFASRVWLDTGMLLAEGFEPRIASVYGTAFEQLAFAAGPEAARGAINSWVADQTRDRIQDLLPEGSINAQTRLVLANAVYLRATWSSEFTKEATWDAPFHVEAGAVDVPTMHQTSFLAHGVTDGYRAVELDYRGSNLSMVLVMPTPGTMEAFESGLTAEAWQALVGSLEAGRVRLSMPKFEMDAHADLKEALSGMGMEVAFTDRADFSRMTVPEPVMIGGVFHGAFVRVDEAGTEAAAATAVVMAPTSAPVEDEPVEITLDHPFIFAIRDKATGAILFLGRVADPR